MKKSNKKVITMILAFVFALITAVPAFADTRTVGDTIFVFDSTASSVSAGAYSNLPNAMGSVSVSSTYYYHNKVTYSGKSTSWSDSGTNYASVSFSAPTGYATSYIYSNHSASYNGSTINPSSSASNN